MTLLNTTDALSGNNNILLLIHVIIKSYVAEMTKNMTKIKKKKSEKKSKEDKTTNLETKQPKRGTTGGNWTKMMIFSTTQQKRQITITKQEKLQLITKIA